MNVRDCSSPADLQNPTSKRWIDLPNIDCPKRRVTTLAHVVERIGKLVEVTSGYFKSNGKQEGVVGRALASAVP